MGSRPAGVPYVMYGHDALAGDHRGILPGRVVLHGGQLPSYLGRVELLVDGGDALEELVPAADIGRLNEPDAINFNRF